jgi:hypothetical protein
MLGTASGFAQSPGTLAFGAAEYLVAEEGGAVQIAINRTDGTTGAVSVTVSTVNGTAKAPGDFAAITNQVVSFADGETSKMVPVTINADAVTTEINENFTVQLASPTGGASLGAIVTATVVIMEADTTLPTVTITTPIINANLQEGVVNLTGTANDNKGVHRVEFSLNGAPYQDALVVIPNTGTTTGLIATYSAVLSPAPGANTLTVRSYDHRGNRSTNLTRNFTYTVLRALTVTVLPAAGGTVTITPALVGGMAKVGTTYTLQANAKPGYFWHQWLSSAISAPESYLPSWTFVMTDTLAVTADFGDEPFSFGDLEFGTADILVREEDGVVQIPIVRTGGSDGIVSVALSSANGAAKAPADYTAVNNLVVTFADGETAKNVPMTINADSITTELNERFVVTLSSPAGGAGLGAVTTAFVTIIEPNDTIPPTVTITTPVANAKVPEGIVTVKGGARDNKGVKMIELSLNGGPYQPATIVTPNTGTTTGQIVTYTGTITPTPGLNTLTARSTDHRDNVSNIVTRTFTYVNMRPLALTIDPVDGGTVTFTPALVGGNAQIGATYTLRATAKPGFFWHKWTAPGVSGPAAESPTLTVVMSEGLAITAGFVGNAFIPGSYNGLARAAAGVTASRENFGFFSGSLINTGRFTGKVNFAGTSYPLVINFDKITGDAAGATAALSYDLHLDLTGGTDKIKGTVTLLASGDECDVDADRATFSASNKVPDQFLNSADPAKAGAYTVVFPTAPIGMQGGLTADEYPQGDGIGTILVNPTGSVSLVGTLADGTTVTSSAPLSKTFAWPLAAIVKSSATVSGVSFGGMVQFDTTQADSDLLSTDLVWFRPAFATAPNYPAGWTGGLLVNAIGAHYDNSLTVQESLGLGTGAPNNAMLVLAEGGLTEEIVKTSFNILGNAVSKLPDPEVVDASYSLTLVPTTGYFNGTFTPNWGDASMARPLFRGALLQKGANKGGYGFFLNNGSGEANKKAGAVSLGMP